MKTKICLLGIFALVTLAIAAPHTWTFQKGGTFEGDYYSSGTTAVVVRKNGTNYIFKFADLSTNDLAYVAKIKADQKKVQLDAEVKQMQQAGWIEITAKVFDNFPEKLRNYQKGWMDVTFMDFSKTEFADLQLGLLVEDSNGDSINKCTLFKQLNRPDQNTQPIPNPVVDIAMMLKKGDKVRLIGHSYPDDSRETEITKLAGINYYTHFGFLVERIEIIETAAEKKAKEQAEDKTAEHDQQTGLPLIQK